MTTPASKSTRTAQDKDIDDRIERLKTAAARLRPYHYTWIVDAARSHFRKAIKEQRIEAIVDAKWPQRVPLTCMDLDAPEPDSRTSEEYLDEYERCLEFVLRLDDLLTHMEAIRFGEAIAEMFGRRK